MHTRAHSRTSTWNSEWWAFCSILIKCSILGRSKNFFSTFAGQFPLNSQPSRIDKSCTLTVSDRRLSAFLLVVAFIIASIIPNDYRLFYYRPSIIPARPENSLYEKAIDRQESLTMPLLRCTRIRPRHVWPLQSRCRNLPCWENEK